MEDCPHCPDHAERTATIDMHGRKIDQNCDELKLLKQRVQELAKLETHFDYMRRSIDDIKDQHRVAIIDMKASYNKTIQELKTELAARIAWMEKLVYAVFAVIVLGGFANLLI